MRRGQLPRGAGGHARCPTQRGVTGADGAGVRGLRVDRRVFLR